MVKMKVDVNKCIGCGACVATCPAAFEMKDGHARFKAEAACALASEAGCPVGAISAA